MATGSGPELRLRSFRPSGVDHLRSVKDGSENRWPKLLRAARSLACALLLLVMLRVLGQGLLLGVAGAALVLLLQEAVDPTPLFWTAPWEAMQLLLSRARRVNHIWLHRTEELARESIGVSARADGFAMADGFVFIWCWQQQAVSPMDCGGCLAGGRPRARERQTSKRMQSSPLPRCRVVDDGGSARREYLERN